MGRSPLKLLLIGFSGVGKSTVLRELQALGASHFDHFFDLDGLVAPAGAAVFIDERGWEEFRREEERHVRQFLAAQGPGVLALGAGAWERAAAHALNRLDVRVCHLQAPFEVCWARLEKHAEERPLLRQGDRAMQELFWKRQPLYEEADFTVDATRPPPAVALAILQGLKLA